MLTRRVVDKREFGSRTDRRRPSRRPATGSADPSRDSLIPTGYMPTISIKVEDESYEEIINELINIYEARG